MKKTENPVLVQTLVRRLGKRLVFRSGSLNHLEKPHMGYPRIRQGDARIEERDFHGFQDEFLLDKQLTFIEAPGEYTGGLVDFICGS